MSFENTPTSLLLANWQRVAMQSPDLAVGQVLIWEWGVLSIHLLMHKCRCFAGATAKAAKVLHDTGCSCSLLLCAGPHCSSELPVCTAGRCVIASDTPLVSNQATAFRLTTKPGLADPVADVCIGL